MPARIAASGFPAPLSRVATYPRRTLFRWAALGLLAIYTIVALAVSKRRALPLVTVEAMLGGYVLLQRFRRSSYSASLSLPAIPARLRGPAGRIVCAIGAVAVHLATMVCLGATSSDRLRPALGIVVMVLGCWACSVHRRHVKWRPVGVGLALQFWLGVFLLRTPWGLAGVASASCGVQALLAHATTGGEFVLGTEMASHVFAARIFQCTPAARLQHPRRDQLAAPSDLLSRHSRPTLLAGGSLGLLCEPLLGAAPLQHPAADLRRGGRPHAASTSHHPLPLMPSPCPPHDLPMT